MEMRELSCPYRFNIRTDGVTEVATCGLLQRIIENGTGSCCDVDRSACEACSAALFSTAARMNPVLPSLVYGACERLLRAAPTSSTERLEQLLAWAEQSLQCADRDQRVTAACDVVLYCQGTAIEVARAAQSILAQQECHFVLHLVLIENDQQSIAD